MLGTPAQANTWERSWHFVPVPCGPWHPPSSPEDSPRNIDDERQDMGVLQKVLLFTVSKSHMNQDVV